jgi:hypothetical protein
MSASTTNNHFSIAIPVLPWNLGNDFSRITLSFLSSGLVESVVAVGCSDRCTAYNIRSIDVFNSWFGCS